MTLFILFLLNLLAGHNMPASTYVQQAPIPDSVAARFLGIWKGSSLCQIRSSPCHDETVVYHISRSAKRELLTIQMNKIVNGQEEEMGAFDFSCNAGTDELVSVGRPDAVWSYQKKGNHMKGKLIYRNQLYRLIDVEKQ